MEERIKEEYSNENEEVKNEKKKKNKFNTIYNVILIVLCVILAIRLIFSIFYSGIYVVGDSMMPNFYGAATQIDKGGDYLFVNKFATPDRGDVVVITVEEDGEEIAIIKRVIGLEGDSLYLNDGQLYIKYAGYSEFTLYNEDYVDAQYNNPFLPYNSTDIITVPEDCIYVLGDNRNISKDSRFEGYGCFSLDNLCGVVTDWSIKYKEPISNVYNYFKF